MKVFAADIVRQVARKRRLSVKDILSKRKLPAHVAARVEIIQRLRDLGLGCSRIARAVNRHHATVRHHFDPEYHARNIARNRRLVAAKTAAAQQARASA